MTVQSLFSIYRHPGGELEQPVALTHMAMKLNESSDEELLHHVARGEVAAFRVLYERHGARVTGLCYKILGDVALAEEVAQETFWRVWRHVDGYEGSRGSFQNWMFGIARNLSIDLLRRRRRVQVEPLHASPLSESRGKRQLASAHDVAETAWASLRQSQVQAALAELPPEQRQVIDWIYFQGKTRREIAEDEAIPFGTINTRARLALDKLRRALQANGYGLEEVG